MGEFELSETDQINRSLRGARTPSATGSSDVRNKRKRTPAAKKARSAATAALMDLSEGDSLEYSISASVRTKRGGEMWVKAGATTTIRAGETAVMAKDRLRGSVEFMIDQAAKEVTS